MNFTDADFYQNEYLQGRNPVVPISEFPFWSTKATNRINWRRVEINPAPDYLQRCVCEVAETLYKQEVNSDPNNVKSETVGPHSKSFQGSNLTADDYNAKINGLVEEYLGYTDLHNIFVNRGP